MFIQRVELLAPSKTLDKTSSNVYPIKNIYKLHTFNDIHFNSKNNPLCSYFSYLNKSHWNQNYFTI